MPATTEEQDEQFYRYTEAAAIPKLDDYQLSLLETLGQRRVLKRGDVVPLWFATGSGAVARRVLGSTVIGGMIAASGIAIFLIPVTFYVIERLFAGHEQKTEPSSEPKPAT